jgi:putative selenium metabolism protein SsnA
MLIHNGMIVTFGSMPKLIRDGAVVIDDNKIVAVGRTDELKSKYRAEIGGDYIDAHGKLVMPGMICAHSHFYSAFARGMALPAPAPTNFIEILERLWWKLDKLLTLDDVYYSAKVCMLDALRNGTTTLLDHHSSPNAIPESLMLIAKAAREIGIRVALAYEISDRNGARCVKEGLEETKRMIHDTQNDELIAGNIGLHASFTLSDETIQSCRDLGDELDVGYHLHVAEDYIDVKDALARSGKRVLERLRDLGILGNKTITVHCVHVNANELSILKATGTHVAHCPQSNMNNAVGVSPVPEMLKNGINVGLGTDGVTYNMFQEFRVACGVHRLANKDPQAIDANTVINMQVYNNSRIARTLFDSPVGELTPGAYADIIIVDYKSPTPLTLTNLPAHFQFGIESSMLDTVIVNGKVRYHAHQFADGYEIEIKTYQRARELAENLWGRL